MREPDAAVTGAAGSSHALKDAGQETDAEVEPSEDNTDGPCQPNPDTNDEVCPEICPERCNGEDDDCDRRIDEEKPSALCHLKDASSVCNDGACLIVECKANHRDCDEDAKNGCETLDDDIDNCGSCGHRCKVPNASPLCVDGTCVVDECKSGWDDCDDNDADCEMRTNTLDDCGGCGVACKDVPHAEPSCETGACGVGVCEPGFGDCDGEAENGCEATLDTLDNCGACDSECVLASCGGGVCSAIDCSLTPGLADCDADGASCEVNLLTDVDNCVACNNVCAFDGGVTPNGELACSTEGCDVACDHGFGDCDTEYRNGCEQALDVVAHCGACDTNCNTALANTTSTSCDGGTLTCRIGTCAAGFSSCDGDPSNGCEVDLHTVQNCGGCANMGQNQACENRANANTACAAGSCTITSCASANYADCDSNVANGCERDARAPASGGLGPCLPDTGCTKFTNGNHEYYYCPTARTWSDARTHCQQQLRGDLAQFVDAAEKDFVKSHLSAVSWIGDNDSLVEGLWVWANNRMPFWQGTASGAALFSQYTNWAAGEPNASGDCGQLYLNGEFDDTDCAAQKPFVCEVSPDDCQADANKSDAGQCGCGNPDTDTDNDGFAVCNDACPSDPGKRAAGVCGCGTADTDSDLDGTPNCHDGCPNDMGKTAAGGCGCGVADTDSDNDGTPNCNDGCPGDSTLTAACFPFTVTNFDPKAVDFSVAPTTTLNCNATVTVTTSATGATFTNWCGTLPVPSVQVQNNAPNAPDGPSIVVIPLRGLTVSAGTTLRLVGTQPVVFAVRGNVSIAGTVDASASGTTAGAGGNWSCGTSQGRNGTGDTGRFNGASGGGGGGFGTAGGKAGTADTDGSDVAGGNGGVARGDTSVHPLYGGCAGGQAGDCGTAGGAGGGAVQIVASGTLTVTSTVRANGGAGATPCGSSDEGGGTGGGSGGAIVLQAATVTTAGSTLQANGGNGGKNGNYAGIYNCGGSNGGNGSTSSSNNGSVGASCQGGSSGGGGGYGRIKIN